MTYQRDPDERDPAQIDPIVPKVTQRRDPRDYVRREDGSWNIVPLILGALVVIVVGYMFIGDPATEPDRTNPGIQQSPPSSVPKTN
jgi:hypothetical protein